MNKHERALQCLLAGLKDRKIEVKPKKEENENNHSDIFKPNYFLR